MIARAARSARSGITLTEILIAIMIMGVGLISLATLFPLGLLRMREASRYNRTGLLVETAGGDVDARELLFKTSFLYTWYGPRDPFVQDILANGNYMDFTTTPPTPLAMNSEFAGLSAGIPIAYDPLWRAVTGVLPSTALVDKSLNNFAPAYTTAAEARFGAAVIGTTPSEFNIGRDPDTKIASAHGLQRLTNFIPYPARTGTFTPLYNFTHYNAALTTGQPKDVAADIFTSIDDIVFNPTSNQANAYSPLLPDLSGGGMVADYKYSWFFTGRQVDVTNGAQFTGDVVICDSRPFGFDTVPNLNGGTVTVPAGETVVEAIFGFGKNIPEIVSGMGFTAGGDRSVLLRWKVGMPDPQVRVGGWIADVTYERDPTMYKSRAVHGTAAIPIVTPFARCHWYQVNKRTEAETETSASAGINDPGKYRRMVLILNSNVKTRTLLYTATAKPVNSNFALVMPSVINVFPRAFEVH